MLDLSDKRELEWLAQLVADIRTAVPGIEPLLVGALARDLFLHYGRGFEIERATTDVDFGLAVDSWDQFSATQHALIASGLFSPFRGAPHRLKHARFGWVDVVPFGAVEQSDGTIAWPPAGDEVMGVMGYAEAAAAAIAIVLPNNQSARVVSLPMLAVLKVFAWHDRYRFTQGKDAVDLQLILRRCLEAGNLDRLYSEFSHFITESFDFDLMGAWLLGLDARTAMSHHSSRFDQVIGALSAVLAPEVDANGRLTLVLQLAPHDPTRALGQLAAFYDGLMGAEAP